MSDDEGILEFPQRPGGLDPEVVHGVEALLFASGDPVSAAALALALGLDPVEVRTALRVLAQRRIGSGVTLEEVGAGWQLRTSVRFADRVAALLGTKPLRLSRPSLEVLAAVAYRQPVTKGDVDRLRGVDSGGVLKSLVDKGLLRVAGRSEDAGRPLLYRTTPTFLERFSLPDLSALPTILERESLVRGEGVGAEPAAEE